MYEPPAPNLWPTVDSWWATFTRPESIATRSETARWLGLEVFSDCWTDLDAWWQTYADTGTETAVELADLVDASTQAWAASDAPFDTDPLAVDLDAAHASRGPLRPTSEVAWSRWLARLLRPSGRLATEVFDAPVAGPPERVVREEQVPKDNDGFRRPDILLFYADRGVSIEVKLEDTNYEKTAETAALVEGEYPDRAWEHVLLLPKAKRSRLEAVVDVAVTAGSEGRPRIEWSTPGPVAVRYWRDVTAALRGLLRRGLAPDDHWAANAYLCCAVAERRLLGFQAQPTVKRLADPGSVVETIRPIQLAGTLEEQLTYYHEQVGV